MAGAQAAWGIDVGVSSLKAIKLRKDGQRVTIEEFEVIDHDQFLTEPDVNRDTMIRSTLQKFMTKHNAKRDVVFIGVPGSMAFARFVKLPPVETKKIPEIVRFEAIQQIPFPLDQVNWDYHTFQHPDSPDVEVGIFAMKKELVAGVMSNFRAVEMNVQGVVMTPIAVYNAAAYDGMTEDKGTVVIDMGAEHTDLVIIDQGRLWLRTINIGGNHFTDALAKSFKQPFARAETLKKTAATSKYQKQIYQAMRPIFADLVAEIQRSIGHYNSTHRDSRLEHIVGMGNPFKLPNLQKYLQQELKMDVKRLESYRMANVEKAAAFSENILSMTAAYGLAVQALGLAPINTNLLPVEIARQMMWKRKQPWFIASAALLAIGAGAIALQTWRAGAAFHAHSDPGQGERNDNDMKESTYQTLVSKWTGINDNAANAKKALDDQMSLLTQRKVWPMLYADIMASLAQVSARGGPPIVVTGMDSEYKPQVWSEPLDTPLSGVMPGVSAMAAPTQGVPLPAQPPPNVPMYGTPVGPAPAPTAGAPAAPTNTTGLPEHGFIVQITGYVPNGSYQTVDAFRSALAAKAPAPPTASNKPYIIPGTSFYAPGQTIKAPLPTTPTTGFVGGGGMGMNYTPSTPAGTPNNDRPWGTSHGPYWTIFAPDLVNWRPPETAAPGMGGMPGGLPGGMGAVQGVEFSDFTFPVDLYTTRSKTPPQPASMNNAYSFTIRFKVHLKDDAK